MTGTTQTPAEPVRTGGLRGRFRQLYGASPWQLVALLGCFALSGYTVYRLYDDAALIRIAVWFVGAALVWDLVVGPLFALVDKALRPLGSPRLSARGVCPLNFVRVPGLLSAMLFMVWAPVILKRSEGTFAAKAGLGLDVFLGRWLALTVALFAVSAMTYLVAVARSSRSA